ncbi:MAG TPA: FAD-binding protein [Natronosporangium sp.]
MPTTAIRTFTDLRKRLAGELVLPGDPDWDLARSAWNLTADQRPAAVAIAATPDDVAAVVNAARAAGLRVAVQSTGHGAAPLTELGNTVLLKTSRLRTLQIDAGARQAIAGAGCLWIEVTRPASAAGLAPLAGSSPDVGVAGYTLGGGLSWLARRHGLAASSVTELQVVTADGRLRRVDATHDPDLFWALRGGGGSFGAVTELRFTLYPVPALSAGWLVWPMSEAARVLTGWREWLAGVPDTVTSIARLVRFPDLPELPDTLRGRQLVLVEAAILGDQATSDRLLRGIRALRPELDTFAATAPVALSRLHMDPEQPVPVAGDHALLGDLPPAAVDALLAAAGPGVDTPVGAVELRHLGGALARRPPGAGVLATLEGEFLLHAAGVVPTPAAEPAVLAAATGIVQALQPWHTSRGYLNFAESRSADPSRLFGPDAARRLAAIKAEVDPTDLFHANHPVGRQDDPIAPA